MEDLLPENKKAQDALFKALGEIDTGIVGPTDVYYPLTVNFPANKRWLISRMSELYGRHNAHVYLYDKRAEFGFFGGTMFWARFDALETLLQFRVDRFEIEAGQVDGTYAHAQERLFCIIPEVESRKLYEVSNDGVKPRAHKTANVPDWSEDHYK